MALEFIDGTHPMAAAADAHFRFDHINIQAAANAPALRLFSDIMQFKAGERPPFPFPGRWLYDRIGQAVLHLVEMPPSHGEAIQFAHIAFRTDEVADSVLARLDEAGFSYEVAVVPEAGDVQIFVSLPGGLIVELDTPADPERPAQTYRSRLARKVSGEN